MAGGYFIKVEGLQELIKGMEGSAKGLRDLTRLNRTIAMNAMADVRRRTPVYHGGHKGTIPGLLRSQISSDGNRRSAWVQINNPEGFLRMQEFGGSSYWYRKHSLKGSGKTTGHIIYKKKRDRYGYFIWNVAYRIRGKLSRIYVKGIVDICQRNGVAMEAGRAANLFNNKIPGSNH